METGESGDLVLQLVLQRVFVGTKKAEVISLEKNENQKARGDFSVVFVFLR